MRSHRPATTTPARRFRAASVLLGALLAAAGVARADDYGWNVTGNGSFGTDTNWSPAGVPDAGDNLFFDRDAATAYTVTLDDDYSIGSFQVQTDRVILDLNGRDLFLTNATTGSNSTTRDADLWMTALMVGRGTPLPDLTFDHGSLVLTGGGTLTTVAFLVGGTSQSTSSLIVENGATLKSTGGSTAFVGFSGPGELTIRSGGVVDMASTLTLCRKALLANRASAVLVEGQNSLLKTTADVQIAFRSYGDMTVRDQGAVEARRFLVAATGVPGTLRIESGATVTTSDRIEVGTDGGGRSTGQVIVTGENSRLTVGGTNGYGSFGSLYADATDKNNIGILTVADGGRAAFGNRLQFWSKGELEVDRGVVTAPTLLTSAGAQFRLTLHTGVTAAAVTTTSHATLNNLIFTLSLADGFSADVDDVFTVLAYGGNLTGGFAGLAPGDTVSTPEGYDFLLGYGTGNSSAITLTVTAIPEPATLGLLLAAGLLLRFRRRAG